MVQNVTVNHYIMIYFETNSCVLGLLKTCSMSRNIKNLNKVKISAESNASIVSKHF